MPVDSDKGVLHLHILENKSACGLCGRGINSSLDPLPLCQHGLTCCHAVKSSTKETPVALDHLFRTLEGEEEGTCSIAEHNNIYCMTS